MTRIKNIVRLVLTLAVFLTLSNSIQAQKGFEGKIKFKSVSEDGKEHFIDYFIKGNQFRIEMPGAMGGAMIVNKEKMTMLMPDQKMYIEFEMDKVKESIGKIMEKAGEAKDRKSDSDFKFEDWEKYKTGKTKEIFGHECEQLVYNDEETGEQVEVWYATDMGDFMFAQNPMMPNSNLGWQDKIGTTVFPMQVTVKDSNGKVKEIFEVVELNKESLSDSLFEVPAGFQKMSIPGMNFK